MRFSGSWEEQLREGLERGYVVHLEAEPCGKEFPGLYPNSLGVPWYVCGRPRGHDVYCATRAQPVRYEAGEGWQKFFPTENGEDSAQEC